MSEFDVNGYNSHECDIHNHGYYLGAQAQQAKIDELQARIDGAMKYIEPSDELSHKAYRDLVKILKAVEK